MRWLSWLRRPLSLIASRGRAQAQHGAAACSPSPLRAARPRSASSSSSGDSFVTARSRGAATAPAAPEAAAEDAYFSPKSVARSEAAEAEPSGGDRDCDRRC